jgi:hypothetical protein
MVNLFQDKTADRATINRLTKAHPHLAHLVLPNTQANASQNQKS